MEKKFSIKKLIRECFEEVMSEAVTGSVNISKRDPNSQNPNYLKRYTQQGISVNIGENKIEEMARSSSGYKLTDDYKEKLATLPEKIRTNKWVVGIIAYLSDPEHSEASIAKIAKDVFDRPQQAINMLIAGPDGLVKAGIMTPASGQAVEKVAAQQDKEAARAAARKAAEDAGEEYVEDDEDDETRQISINNYTDAEDLFVGGGFKDNFDTDILHSGGGPDKEEPVGPSPVNPDTDKSAAAKAAEFFLDNDRMLQRIINTYGLVGQKKIKENADGDDKMISAKTDWTGPEKNRADRARIEIDTLVMQFVDKIKTQEPEVQQSILDMLSRKLPGSSQRLYNKIVKALGTVAPVETPEPSNDEEELDIDDLLSGEEPDSLPPVGGDLMENEDEEVLNEDFKRRLQVLSGIIT